MHSELLRILAADYEPDYDDELWWAPPSRSLGWASLAGPRSRDCLAVISQLWLTFVCWSQHNFHPGPGLAWPGLGGASVTNLEALEPPWPGQLQGRAGASVMRAPGPGIRTWVSPASGRADSGECGVRVGARSRRLDTGDTHSNPASGVKRETTSVTSGDQGREHYPGTTARCHKTHHTEQSPSVTRKYHCEKKKKYLLCPSRGYARLTAGGHVAPQPAPALLPGPAPGLLRPGSLAHDGQVLGAAESPGL